MINSISHHRSRQGVTLIEAIMVITLLAAAAGASLIRMDNQWVARREVTLLTHEIADSLQTARNTAITNQATLRVRRVRQSGLQQLLITEEAGPFRGGNSWTVDLGRDARLRGAPTEIQFYPTGAANRTLDWTITQSRTDGQVTVTPATGQVARRLP